MSAGARALPDPARPWARAAFAPFAWLAAALLLASLLALLLGAVLPGGPDAGAWNPLWGFAEAELAGADAPAARELADEARRRFPEARVELRPEPGGPWLVLVGPEEGLELLGSLQGLLRERGRAPARIGFGSNLARITARLLDDPSAAADAAEALLPLTLFGGGLVLLVLGAWLRASLPSTGPAQSHRPAGPAGLARRVAAGVALGVLLALVVAGLAEVAARLGHPVTEQGWLVRRLEADGTPWAVLATVVVVAPLAEEVFFRGYLLEALRRPWGAWGSLLLSSAAFAGVHGHAPALPAYLAYGVGLGLAARRSGSLVVPVTAHATVNALAVAWLAWGSS